MSSLLLARSIILWSSNLFAFIILGLCAWGLQDLGGYAIFITYPALGVATSVLHLASVLPMVIIALLRDGAFTSKLVVEASWLSFLWIMWLATGALSAATYGGSVTPAVTAFGFILWAMLLGYVITLICFAVRASQAGHNIWMSDVKQVHWLEGTANVQKPNLASPHPNVATYPPGGHPGNTSAKSPGAWPRTIACHRIPSRTFVLR